MNLTHSRGALVAALRASSELPGLLAADPKDKTAPAIFYMNPLPAPVYPCVVYNFGQFIPDDRFRPTLLEGGGPAKISEGRLEIRCYNKTTAELRDAISTEVSRLIDGVRLPLTEGVLFRVELLGEFQDQFDTALNAFYTLLRFRLRHSL